MSWRYRWLPYLGVEMAPHLHGCMFPGNGSSGWSLSSAAAFTECWVIERIDPLEIFVTVGPNPAQSWMVQSFDRLTAGRRV
jgi:hypothetical protein